MKNESKVGHGALWSLAVATALVGLAVTTSASAQPAPPEPGDEVPAGEPEPSAPVSAAPVPAPAPAPQPSAAVPAPHGALPAPTGGRNLTLLEAIQTTLRSHPSIRFASNDVDAQRAALLAQKGPFDPVVSAQVGHRHDELPVLPAFSFGVPGYDSDVVDTTSADLGASWFSRWGMTVQPSVGLARIHQRPGGSATVPGLPSAPYHQARVDLTVTQSLLRGAGTVGAASGIEAAELGREASKFLLSHTAQQQVFRAVAAYFQLVAAHEIVEMLEDNRQRAQKLVDDTTELVRADQRPAADLRQLRGNLANRARYVHDARNAELRALYELSEAMGLGAENATAFVPVDPLPPPRDFPIDERDVVRRARSTRMDLKALGESVRSADASLAGAEKNTQPALDLSVSVGYNGAIDDDGVGPFFASSVSNIPGVSGGVNLALQLPVQNIERAAERDVNVARRDRAKIALKDLRRRVPIDALTALNDVKLSAAALAESTRAAEQFQLALESERDRLREGAGTVIDVVFAQDQLILALQNRVFDHARYAVAVSRFYFELGEMPDEERETMMAASKLLGRQGSGEGDRAGQ